MSDAVRAEKIAHEVDDAARQLAQAGRLDLTREFIQHGDVTVYAHVTSVARASLSFAEHLGRAGISIDRASLLRGALLHDMFPLVPVPPTCREAWIVCLADKWCALRETIAGRLPRKDETDDSVSKASSEKRRG